MNSVHKKAWFPPDEQLKGARIARSLATWSNVVTAEVRKQATMPVRRVEMNFRRT